MFPIFAIAQIAIANYRLSCSEILQIVIRKKILHMRNVKKLQCNWRNNVYNLRCFIAFYAVLLQNMFFTIYAVSLQNKFCCDLSAFAWKKLSHTL